MWKIRSTTIIWFGRRWREWYDFVLLPLAHHNLLHSNKVSPLIKRKPHTTHISFIYCWYDGAVSITLYYYHVIFQRRALLLLVVIIKVSTLHVFFLIFTFNYKKEAHTCYFNESTKNWWWQCDSFTEFKCANLQNLLPALIFV